MFQEYKRYIENIRNSMIQNNIQLRVSELNTYEDVFYYALSLEQVIWFYQVMGIGGSEYSIESPYILTECYKEKVRQIAYKDFIQTIEGIRNLGDRYRAKKIENNIPLETKGLSSIDLDESIDLFSEDLEEDKVAEEKIVLEPVIPDIIEQEEQISPKTFLNLVQSYSNSVPDMVQLKQSDGNIVHGIFIDEWIKPSPREEEYSVPKESNTDGIVHGIFIDEWVKEEEEKSFEEVTDNEVHGIYIDLWVKPKKVTNNIKDEDIHGIYIDEWQPKEKVEVKVEDFMFNDFDKENLFEDSIVEDEEDTFSMYSNSDNVVSKKEEKVIPKGQRDISDSIQDVTNKLLTEGKRLFVNKVKKLQQ